MTVLNDGTMLRERAAALDAGDPLVERRRLFDLPDGLIYLDGNSLGALPKGVRDRVDDVIGREWGRDLIRSWNTNGWMEYSRTIGAKIAPLIGADGARVRACDSTSVNLLKVLSAALSLRNGRSVIVSERGNFPSDLYVAEGLIAGLGCDHDLRLVDDAETDLCAVLDENVAAVMLTQVDYRTGRKLDLRAIASMVHEVDALLIVDLAHSAGAVSPEIETAKVDFAIGCGYKFLNGGPGAPAFLFVSDACARDAVPILTGWFGHDRPFSFESGYAPAPGIERFLTGTPPVLSMAALDRALDVFENVRADELQVKGGRLGDVFIEAVEALVPRDALTLASPRDAARRGAQVSFHHKQGYAVMQALIARGVIGDFREPDIIRFGYSPLYVRYEDCVAAAEILADVLQKEEWRRPDYARRAAVT